MHVSDFVDFASHHDVAQARPTMATAAPRAEHTTARWLPMGDPFRDRMWIVGHWDELEAPLHDDLAQEPGAVETRELAFYELERR